MESLPSLYGTPFEVHNTEPKGEEVEKEDEEEKIKTMHYQEAQALATCCKVKKAGMNHEEKLLARIERVDSRHFFIIQITKYICR